MPPTTKRTTQRVLLRVSLLLALLTALAGIGQSQTASPCLSSQLSARHETDDQSMGGRVSLYFSFRNNSKSPCTLNGTPAVVLIDRAGRRMKTKVEKYEEPSIQPKAVRLAPGGKAFFEVRYSSCEVQNGALEHKMRCKSSAKLGFTPLGATGMVMIREAIDPGGWLSGVSPIVATLKEFGIESSPDTAQRQTAATCTQLSLQREAKDSAMGGRRSLFYSFTNNSPLPCTLEGWPRYVLLDGAGHPLKATSAGGEGEPDDPAAVTLAPGGKAFFSVNYTSCSFTTTGRYKRCPYSAKARITAPGTKHTFSIREVIDPEGPYFDVRPIARTLEQLGIIIEKPKP